MEIGTRVRQKDNPTQLGTVDRVGGNQPECLVRWDHQPDRTYVEWFGDLEVIEDAAQPSSD